MTNFASVVRESVDELTSQVASVIKGERKEIDYTDVQDLLEMIDVNASKIENHGLRADRIVNSMMDHVRVPNTQFVSVSLNELVDQFVNLAYTRYSAENEGFEVALHRSYDPDVSEIKAFPQELGKVFYNLLDNSFFAVQQHQKLQGDGYLPEVHVKTEKEEAHILVEVRDNGIGINESDRDKVFEPFFTTKPTGKGSIGLGLSLSYDIVVNGHGGGFTVSSKSGEGSSFVVKLPIS